MDAKSHKSTIESTGKGKAGNAKPKWSNGRPKTIRKRGRPGALLRSQLEEEALALKNEKYKTFLESWRLERDRKIAGAIVDALRGALLAFKENVSRGMAINAAIDSVIDSLEAVDLEIVLAKVEDDEEEDELAAVDAAGHRDG